MICDGFCRAFSRRLAENQVAQTDPEGSKWRQMSERRWFIARANSLALFASC